MKKKTKKKETLNLKTITSVMIDTARLNLSALEKTNRNLDALIGAMTEIIAMKAQLNRIELLISSITTLRNKAEEQEKPKRFSYLSKFIFWKNNK